jgi:hypothetical protein
LHDISQDYLRFILRSKYAAGDVEKAMELLVLHQKSISGSIVSYNPNVNMLGAENRGNVTCYLDALLFAMFAKLEAFECMLKNDLANEPQRNLAALIRLWVNMLRSGKLIHTDMVWLSSSRTEPLFGRMLTREVDSINTERTGCLWLERCTVAGTTGYI